MTIKEPIAALREHIAKIIAVLWFLALSLLFLFAAVALWGTFPQKIQDILSNSQTVLSTEVLQWLLNLIGISSFAVEVVNERSTQRCQGILLGDVLRHYFPFYRAAFVWLKQIPLKKAEPLQMPPDSQACRTAFCSIFSSSEGHAPGERVLFTGGLPGHPSERTASSTQFRQEVLRCSAVWDNLLTQLDGSRRKSQMAFHILSCAKQFSPECFAIFAGGLILQSQALYFKSERDGTEKLWAAINFLRGLYREEEESSLMQDASIASISAEWLELMLITAAGLLWNCAFQFHSPRQVRGYCRFIRQAVYHCNSSAVRQELAANYPVYITYTFALTWATNVEVCQKLSICQQTLFYDYVRREMADMLAG